MVRSKGYLVSLEGIDGSGKSTQAPLLEKYLLERGIQVKYTQEPTKRKIGVLLRQYLRDPHSSPLVDALLFAADRVEHYLYEIKPLIEDGYIVISDRYVESSIVYQGFENREFEWIRMINNKVPAPDLRIFIDVSIEDAMQRIESASRENLEKFEQLDLLRRIKDVYSMLIDDGLFAVVSGEGREEEVTKRLVEQVTSKFQLDLDLNYNN